MTRQPNSTTVALLATAVGATAASIGSAFVGAPSTALAPTRALPTATHAGGVRPHDAASDSSALTATSLGGCLGLLAVGLSRRSERFSDKTAKRGRVTVFASDVQETVSEDTAVSEPAPKAAAKAAPKAAPKAAAAPKAKAEAAPKAAPKKKAKKAVPPLVDQVFQGPWAPLITLGCAVVGEPLTFAIRSKGIMIHTKVITEFCTTFNMPSKRRQGWIKLAKNTGHDDMGMLVEGGHFGDGLLGPAGIEFWKESGLEKWKP